MVYICSDLAKKGGSKSPQNGFYRVFYGEKVKRQGLGPVLGFFHGVFQQFFQIVGSGGHMHAFVGLPYAQSIDLAHTHELGQG
ncbi:hypothetical protein [Maribacter sp. 2304DJ31-5]|uniref:hypothetical protein n=1 Tax=Maribacter sp. 2304DJ31-5 TaxID=3386273 RepID=UPI0039BCC362